MITCSVKQQEHCYFTSFTDQDSFISVFSPSPTVLFLFMKQHENIDVNIKCFNEKTTDDAVYVSGAPIILTSCPFC